MAAEQNALAKLQQYAGKVRGTNYDLEPGNDVGDYEARINKTLQSLQNQVKQQTDALEKVQLYHIGQ